MEDLEEVVMLTRSILASKKHAITFFELQKEYYELNATRLPFKQLGFDSMVLFFQNFPDKFQIQKNDQNEFVVKAKVDDEMIALSKLVAGQRNNKKKKSKPKTRSFRQAPSNQFRFAKFEPRPPLVNRANSYSNSHSFQDRLQKRPIEPLMGNNNNFTRFYSAASSSANINVTVTENNTRKVSIGLPPKCESRTSSQRNLSKRTNSTLKLNIDLPQVEKSQFIDNAAYFLKEHPVILSNFRTCSSIYVRLIGPNFSDQYDKMIKRLNTDYQNQRVTLKDIQVDKHCVAFDINTSRYYRAQIKKVLDQKALCFNVDDAKCVSVSNEDLFEIKEEYLELKFQSINVELLDFDKFNNNDYILSLLKNEYCFKRFIARRTQNSPLTVALYEEDTNVYFNESFLNLHENFIMKSLEQDQVFEAHITYIDEDLNLVYMQYGEDFRYTFFQQMQTINQYYSASNHVNSPKDYEIIFKNAEEFQNTIYYAKYDDDKWYRARIIKKLPNENNVFVNFIDFGNKEKVPIENIRLNEKSFVSLKNLPPQAFSVFVLNHDAKKEELKEFMYEDDLLRFKVKYLNSFGKATVELLERISTTSSSLSSSSTNLTEELEEFTENLSNLNLENTLEEEAFQEDSNEIENILFEHMKKHDLVSLTVVSILISLEPNNFFFKLLSAEKEMDIFSQNLQTFYSENFMNYKVRELTTNGIYVAKDDKNVYRRVKLDKKYTKLIYKVHLIDSGGFDIVEEENIFHITKRFAKIKPFAIKGCLANIVIEETWPDKTIEFFKKNVTCSSLFQIRAKYRSIENSESYKVDLIDPINNQSISNLLAENGFAKNE